MSRASSDIGLKGWKESGVHAVKRKVAFRKSVECLGIERLESILVN